MPNRPLDDGAPADLSGSAPPMDLEEKMGVCRILYTTIASFSRTKPELSAYGFIQSLNLDLFTHDALSQAELAYFLTETTDDGRSLLTAFLLQPGSIDRNNAITAVLQLVGMLDTDYQEAVINQTTETNDILLTMLIHGDEFIPEWLQFIDQQSPEVSKQILIHMKKDRTDALQVGLTAGSQFLPQLMAMIRKLSLQDQKRIADRFKTISSSDPILQRNLLLMQALPKIMAIPENAMLSITYLKLAEISDRIQSFHEPDSIVVSALWYQWDAWLYNHLRDYPDDKKILGPLLAVVKSPLFDIASILDDAFPVKETSPLPYQNELEVLDGSFSEDRDGRIAEQDFILKQTAFYLRENPKAQELWCTLHQIHRYISLEEGVTPTQRAAVLFMWNQITKAIHKNIRQLYPPFVALEQLSVLDTADLIRDTSEQSESKSERLSRDLSSKNSEEFDRLIDDLRGLMNQYPQYKNCLFGSWNKDKMLCNPSVYQLGQLFMQPQKAASNLYIELMKAPNPTVVELALRIFMTLNLDKQQQILANQNLLTIVANHNPDQLPLALDVVIKLPNRISIISEFMKKKPALYKRHMLQYADDHANTFEVRLALLGSMLFNLDEWIQANSSKHDVSNQELTLDLGRHFYNGLMRIPQYSEPPELWEFEKEIAQAKIQFEGHSDLLSVVNALERALQAKYPSYGRVKYELVETEDVVQGRALEERSDALEIHMGKILTLMNQLEAYDINPDGLCFLLHVLRLEDLTRQETLIHAFDSAKKSNETLNRKFSFICENNPSLARDYYLAKLHIMSRSSPDTVKEHFIDLYNHLIQIQDESDVSARDSARIDNLEQLWQSFLINYERYLQLSEKSLFSDGELNGIFDHLTQCGPEAVYPSKTKQHQLSDATLFDSDDPTVEALWAAINAKQDSQIERILHLLNPIYFVHIQDNDNALSLAMKKHPAILPKLVAAISQLEPEVQGEILRTCSSQKISLILDPNINKRFKGNLDAKRDLYLLELKRIIVDNENPIQKKVERILMRLHQHLSTKYCPNDDWVATISSVRTTLQERIDENKILEKWFEGALQLTNRTQVNSTILLFKPTRFAGVPPVELGSKPPTLK